jgi:hypothetical protein
MNSYAQAFQDLFVVAMLGGKRNSSYLDVGCFDPVEGNNTQLLDVDFGWDGMSIDHVEQSFGMSGRRGTFIHADATQPPSERMCRIRDRIAPDGVIDYLSLDVDEDTNKALPHLLDFARYRVITIEHDVYARGVEQQEEQRKMLYDKGYVLQCPDVHMQGQPELVFEDWWCAPEIAMIGPELGHDAHEIVKKIWLHKYNRSI